jgi:hypothetical protein
MSGPLCFLCASLTRLLTLHLGVYDVVRVFLRCYSVFILCDFWSFTERQMKSWLFYSCVCCPQRIAVLWLLKPWLLLVFALCYPMVALWFPLLHQTANGVLTSQCCLCYCWNFVHRWMKSWLLFSCTCFVQPSSLTAITKAFSIFKWSPGCCVSFVPHCNRTMLAEAY